MRSRNVYLATGTLTASTARRQLCSSTGTINVVFKNRKGEVVPVVAEVGKTVLNIAHKYGIELEGACEGVCACSTCHVYVQNDFTDSFPKPSEEEEDVSSLHQLLMHLDGYNYLHFYFRCLIRRLLSKITLD